MLDRPVLWDRVGVGAGSLLDRPSYLYWEVDRLIGLPSGTARRWINGYQRGGRSYAPILRDAPFATEWATWGEFVEARILSEFRDQRVPTTRLRAAVLRLRDDFQVAYPLAHMRPYLEALNGQLVVRDGLGGGRHELTTGQRILEAGSVVMRVATLTEDESGESVVAELPLDPEFPSIRTHPDRLSGQPTIEGRRIAVVTVAGMAEAGEPRSEIAATYGISIANVDDAVSYARKYRLAA